MAEDSPVSGASTGSADAVGANSNAAAATTAGATAVAVSSAPAAPAAPVAAKPAGGPPPRIPIFSAEAWTPLKVELFRSLYIATSVAQIGTWIREAGGPWLMKIVTDGDINQPTMVGRVLLFSNLPICLFSVFAGALADVLDRRRLLIFTQAWMMVVSAILGFLTVTDQINASSLLWLTFLVGAGTAAAGPALQALLPELVPKKDLALAINLNSVALNVARALGPGTFILVISIIPDQAGVGASFFLTALSFVWAIYVLFKWKREPQRAAVHGEEMWSAIRAGFSYTIHSRANRAILLRVLTFIVPAVVMWSQVPLIATRQLNLPRESITIADSQGAQKTYFIAPKVQATLNGERTRLRKIPINSAVELQLATDNKTASAINAHTASGSKSESKLVKLDQGVAEKTSALLFAFVGLGAVFGVLIMPGLQRKYQIDPVVNVCTGCFAAGLMILSFVHSLPIALAVMVFLGINWVIIPTNFNTATQKSVPLWVKGRAISFYLTVLFGSFTIGSAIWGPLTTATSIHMSLMTGGIAMAVLLVLAKWFPLTLNDGLDLSAAFAGPPAKPVLPPIAQAADPVASTSPKTGAPIGDATAPVDHSKGTTPVKVVLNYAVEPGRAPEFLSVMTQVESMRRRNGASAWRLSAAPNAASNGAVTYEEVIRYRSGAEHSRQPARMTKADLTLLDRAASFNAAGEAPSGHSELLVGDEADEYLATKKWLARRLADGFDRLFDAIASVFDRNHDMKERERQSRKAKYREIKIRIPE